MASSLSPSPPLLIADDGWRNAGISQRDTTLYDFLQPEQARTEIRDLIRRFWEESIRDHAPLHNCTPHPLFPHLISFP